MTKTICFSILLALFGGCVAPVSHDSAIETQYSGEWLSLKTAPKAIHMSAPTFPFEEARFKMSGIVKVILNIGERGQISELHVVESTAAGFSEAVRTAVMKWQFDRGTGGRYKQQFTFSSDGGMGGDIEWLKN